MARFTLVIRPDGKALLTCQDSLTLGQVEEVRTAVGSWEAATDAPVLVITDCDVVQVVDLELSLGGELVEVDA